MTTAQVLEYLVYGVIGGGLFLVLREGRRRWKSGTRALRELEGEIQELDRSGTMGPHLTEAVALGKQLEEESVETREYLRTRAFTDPDAARRWERMLLKEHASLGRLSAEATRRPDSLQTPNAPDPFFVEREELDRELASCRALLRRYADADHGGAG